MKLTPEQVQRFETDGYLIAENVLTDADLAPVIAEIDAMVDAKARDLHAQGKITDLRADLPFERRLAALVRQCPDVANRMDIMEARGRASFEFLSNKNFLDAVECLVGPEITCNPIQHLRAKVGSTSGGDSYISGDVPWHQDAGVTWKEGDASLIITCWVPLVNATRANGCMEIIPKVHQKRYLEHVLEGGTQIRPELIAGMEPICAQCPRGGVVFMTQFTPHRGLSSQQPDTARWTMDLRYQKTGTPTGRPFWPDFVVRSRSNPANEMKDHARWCEMWTEALAKPKQPWHRPAKEQADREAAGLAPR